MIVKICLICGKEFRLYPSSLKRRASNYCSQSCASKSRINQRNSNWKTSISYRSLHKWIRENKPKIILCEECSQKKTLEIANISGQYKRDINDYKWLCKSCHAKKDNRVKNIKKMNILGKVE